jgi:ribonuclease P protein component
MKDENVHCCDASSFIFHTCNAVRCKCPFILPMKRSFSLRRDEFQRVWDDGKSWSHPLVILRASANGMEQCRFGFVAGKKIGGAVARNRAKRLMRESMRQHLAHIAPGWDVIVIARSAAAQAELQDIDAAITSLLERAQLKVNP